MSLPSLSTEDFHRLDLFRGLSTTELQPLCDVRMVRDHPAGAVIFRQGEPADHLLLVLSGRLRAWAEAGGVSEPVATVYAGELVGEAALFRAAGLRTATLKATQPTRTLRLTRARLDAMRGERVLAVLQRQMLESTARRLRTTNHAMRRVWKRNSGQVSVEPERSSVDEASTEAEGPWSQFLQALGDLV